MSTKLTGTFLAVPARVQGSPPSTAAFAASEGVTAAWNWFVLDDSRVSVSGQRGVTNRPNTLGLRWANRPAGYLRSHKRDRYLARSPAVHAAVELTCGSS